MFLRANRVFGRERSGWQRISTRKTIEETVAAERFLELPVRIVHTTALRDVPLVHRDPFDRLLVAPARVEGLSLVTSDPVFERYGVSVIAA